MAGAVGDRWGALLARRTREGRGAGWRVEREPSDLDRTVSNGGGGAVRRNGPAQAARRRRGKWAEGIRPKVNRKIFKDFLITKIPKIEKHF